MGETKNCESAHPAFDEFVETIAALRTPGTGCPWDLEQTHASIASNMIEEAFEAIDAIEEADVPHMRGELGDVLLQVVLQSQIAADDGEFTIDDVCRDVNDKIIRRHPHVFGDVEAGSANDVITLWDKIKLQEKAASGGAPSDDGSAGPDVGMEKPKGLLDGVPSSFPALMQAQKVSRKAVAAGFEWETVDDVWDKVDEEIGEFRAAYADAPKDDRGVLLHDAPEFSEAEMEFGDILFSLVNVARKCGIDSERALRATCRKFRARWSSMEDAAWDQGHAIEELDAGELEALWEDAKSKEA